MMRSVDSTDWKALLMVLLQGDDTSITELVLPDGLNRLHAQAIAELKGCVKIVLPSTLAFIGNWNFITCTRIQTLVVNAVTPPTCEANSLASLPSSAQIYVPDGSVVDYQSANRWSNYASRIHGISELGGVAEYQLVSELSLAERRWAA